MRLCDFVLQIKQVKLQLHESSRNRSIPEQFISLLGWRLLATGEPTVNELKRTTESDRIVHLRVRLCSWLVG